MMAAIAFHGDPAVKAQAVERLRRISRQVASSVSRPGRMARPMSSAQVVEADDTAAALCRNAGLSRRACRDPAEVRQRRLSPA
ncbi:hypothetical protein ACRAWD_22245 [Caulobacter segnis]